MFYTQMICQTKKEHPTMNYAFYLLQKTGILITKDNDFFDSYILIKSPPRLLLISTGNIINKDLFILFEKYFDLMISYFETYNFVELTNNELFAHE